MSHHFTHLHLHSDYSLLDGAIKLERLVQFGQENQLKALAITDHGNIFGAVKFFQLCKKAKIKPILGIEAYLTEDSNIKDAEKKYYHIILLVQNAIGYHNLCKLISFSYKEGFYFKPRIDYNILAKHADGLIATSGCLGGHIPQLLRAHNQDEVTRRLNWHLDVFGRDRFFLEIQPEDQKEQALLNNQLYSLSTQHNIDLVATGDCHYPTLDDHEAHETMLCIQTRNLMSDPDRYSFGDCRTYIRTPAEMLAAFPNHEQAIWNSGKIADMCNFDFETGKLFFPKFEIPQEHTQDSFFKALCQKGLDTLIEKKLINAEQKPLYQARLDEEMQLIITMGFVGYFLVVSDFIQWAHRNGIPVGPGRGSAAGSLVAWTLEITNIDPIKYNLLFERFLNPERITMPDIDIDFCIEGRERVIDYVKQKYGHDKVCQIITFGTMLAKGVIKDVARAQGFSFEDSNAITSLIPEQLKITLNEALEQEPRLKELIDNNPKAHKLFDIALRLEGLTRHASKHAAGIVISPEPIDEVLPVYIPPKTDELVTQYAMSELESIGFLKIDLLGLKNLTLIDHTIKAIHKNHDLSIDVNHIPLDDQKTFALLGQGNTSGVFQLESSGLKDVLRKLQPNCFEEIIAVNALYRPGPLGSGMVDDFIERRHGRQKITYIFPELEPILQETYGVIVYQEQVMKIASTIGGYSLGEADILRRAMGKKKAEVMQEQREIFLQKASTKGFDSHKAGSLFDLMAYFAGYGFNKSHSAAYAFIAYQTAYLKAHYPAEFMACLISLESTNAEKMSFYLQETKTMGLDILPPDIHSSEINFSAKNGKIIFGLHGIKNVGLAALENIIAERTKKPFIDLFDFCKRIDLRTSNKRVLEHLIYAGAFDTLPGNRAQKIAELETIMEKAAAQKKEEATGQMGLFSVPTKAYSLDNLYTFAPLSDMSNKEKLEKEKEVIGFYLTSHPLETYADQRSMIALQSFTEILDMLKTYNKQDEPFVTVCGLLTSKKEITTKKGDRMAFIQLEDQLGSAEIVLFPKQFKKSHEWLNQYHVFVIKGTVDLVSTNTCKIKATEMVPIDLFLQEWPNIRSMSIQLPDAIVEGNLELLKKNITKGTIPLDLLFYEQGKQWRLRVKERMQINTIITEQLKSLDMKLKVEL